MYHIFKYTKEFSWEPIFSTPLKRKAYTYAQAMSFRYITRLMLEDEVLISYYMGSEYVE